ncbi:SusC/RagA family TonB-linked outer membrane protein [Rufibacter sediminis]|uniref:TonB-dependent receptor n=1 Tax=Rufibacter sediminis TaxID=2762756 RepID=A0ABR6VXG9_9BACT|nr:TonB-dependent receptor [Rufibacter sediminis]MBC3541844.1 TonB-dependent receptor [Rufibacter sediminis]
MKKALLYSFVLMLALVTQAWAQTRTVTGRVTDAQTGEGMPGVTVQLKGSTTAAPTDVNGSYSINVPSAGGSLVFSFIGYTNQEVTIGTQSTVNVRLSTDAEAIQEVVVVGYGTQSKARVTSSISTVQAAEIKDQPVPNVAQALQGRVAGVQVNSGSGRPGAPINIVVRGRSSIAAGNDPLYVVDGVILPSNSAATPSSAGAGISALANLNPEDIESVDVLKDAAAAAIYGSRGSNGVILITTKSGSKSDKTTVNLSAYSGVQSLTNTLDFINASEYRTLYNEARSTVGLPALFTPEQVNNPEANVNWLDEIQRDRSKVENIQLSLTSGGNSKTQFYTSLNYFKQDGALLNGEFKRYSIRTNVTHQLSDVFRVGSNLAISKSLRDETPVDNSIFSPFPRALVARPDQPIYKADGTFAVNSFNNPVHMFQSLNYVNLANIFNSTFIEANILPGLKFRSAFGLDYTYLDQRTYNPTTSLSGAGSNGSASSGYVQTQNILTTQTLSYGKDFFDDKLFVDATAVYEFQWNDRENNRVDGTNFPSDLTPYLTSAASITGGTASQTNFRIESMLARLNLTWEDKYLLGASIRRDGSSKIPEAGRFGYFPSLSAGWIISEESFLKNNEILNYLKVRSSYGTTGNQEGIGNFASRRLIGSGANYNDSPGLALSAIGSPNLKWETTKQFDVGLEFSLFNSRIDFSADYYTKKTTDLLLNRPIPSTTGFSTILENIGSMRGEGFDFQVSSKNLTGEFKWNTSLNVSTFKNEVTELYENQPINGSFVTRTMVGQPLGSFFLIKSLGVNPETGDMMYEDLDKNGVISDADRQYLGSPLPDFFGGITNNFSYKNFDLGVFFQYSYGNELYNLSAEGTGGYASLGAAATATAGVPVNVAKDVYEGRWTPENVNAEYPRIVGGAAGTNNTRRSSRYLEDASYLRLKNITLGYNLPRTLTSKIKVSNARIYLTGQNILTFTDYSGFDPEVTSDYTVGNLGVDQGSIPQFKTYMLGLNLSF